MPLIQRPHATQKTKLPVTVRMRRAGEPLDVGPQPVPGFVQQPPDGAVADTSELLGQRPQRTFDIRPPARRIPAGFRLDKLLQVAFDAGIIFSTTGRPAPSRRMRSLGQSFVDNM